MAAEYLKLNAAVLSHMGCVRKNNEDNFFVDGDFMPLGEVNDGVRMQVQLQRPEHLIAVTDGMGGLEAGERAAYLAVLSLKELDVEKDDHALIDAVDQYARTMSERIMVDGTQRNSAGHEGTTIAMVYLQGDMAHVSNVGDTRVYILRAGSFVQLSHDHSPLYRAFLNGQITREQMRLDPRSNIIDHFLGQPPEKSSRPDFVHHRSIRLCKGDCFLVCTDGVTDLLPHEQIQQIMCLSAPAMERAERLVSAALEMGGKDNTTAVIAEVDGDHLPLPDENMLKELEENRYMDDSTTST